MDMEVLKLVGGSSPLALMTAYMFKLIVESWKSDRQRLDAVVERQHEVMMQINSTLAGLKTSIDHLTERLDDMEERHSRLESTGRRS